MAKRSTIDRQLIRSMREAVDIAKGSRKPARAYALPLTARSVSATPAPAYNGRDIAAIRRQLNLSQQVFADALNVSLGTVRSWEQGARVPEGPSVRLLELAQKHPMAVLSSLLLRSGGKSVTEYPSAGRLPKRVTKLKRRRR
jgi:putative transcriptional regulator